MEINMDMVSKIIVISGLMAFLYAAGSIYDYRVNKKNDEDNIATIALNIIINMVKIVLILSIVSIVIVFVIFKPMILLLS